MQATINFDDVNAELQMAADEPEVQTEMAVHPFQRLGLGKAPFTCAYCTIGDTRCAYCTTPIRYVYHIQGADGRAFVVGSECVKQTGGAVAGFETFNRQMLARVREMQKQARQQREVQKKADAAAKWQAEHAAEWEFMCKRRDAGNNFYSYLCGIVLQFGSIYESRLESVRNDMRSGASARVDAIAAAPVVNLEAVEQAFAKAKAAGIKWPALRMGGFVFSPAGSNSANAGAIYVKQRMPSGDLPGAYLGKVLGGKFIKSRDCDNAAEVEILEISKDPKAAALAYGKKYGRCSVCNRELSDAASVEAGIGPVCALKYGF